MSGPPGRSATVTSLSGRVNALKFMQRASNSSSTSSPASTPSKPNAPSSSHSTPRASPTPASPAAGSGTTAETEEQWTLSPAAIDKLRAKNQNSRKEKGGPRIVQEAGFDAWLITREKEQQGGSRQTFGSLAKRREEDEESKKRAREEPDFEHSDNDESCSEEEEKSAKGFVKPGDFSKKKSKKQVDSDPPARGKKANQGGKKDQDKVVFARKRGGKAGISGGR